MTVLIADTETNAIWPTKIHLVGLLDYDSGAFASYTDHDVAEGILRMLEADILIGYNLLDYDIRHIERLSEGLIQFDRSRIIDLLPWSRKLCRDMPDHKLATWGARLGFPKASYNHDGPLDYRTMIPYCERDCRLTGRVFETLGPRISGS